MCMGTIIISTAGNTRLRLNRYVPLFINLLELHSNNYISTLRKYIKSTRYIYIYVI